MLSGVKLNASVSRNSPCIQSNAQSRSGCQKPRAEPPAGEQDGSQGPRGAHSAEGTPRDTTAGTAQQIRPRGGVCETPTRFAGCHGEQTGPVPPPAAQTATQTSDEPGFCHPWSRRWEGDKKYPLCDSARPRSLAASSSEETKA